MTTMPALPALAEELHQSTRQLHRELNHHPILSRLTSQNVSEGDYAAALAALRGPQAVLEDDLACFAAPGMNTPFRPRLAELDSDLRGLGRSAYPLTKV